MFDLSPRRSHRRRLFALRRPQGRHRLETEPTILGAFVGFLKTVTIAVVAGLISRGLYENGTVIFGLIGL